MQSLQVTYATGWDDGVVGRLTIEEAAARDDAGKAYVAILHDDTQVVGQIRVARAKGRLEVVAQDGEGRPTALLDLRGSAAQLSLRTTEAWNYRDAPTQASADHTATTYSHDGSRRTTHEPQGKDGGRMDTVERAPQPRFTSPGFGDWASILSLAGVRPDKIVAASTVLPSSSGAAWDPPGPLRPGDMEALFTAGAEVKEEGADSRISLVDAGKIRLPSGNLMALDPAFLDKLYAPDRVGARLVHVVPGTYPVLLAIATSGGADPTRFGSVAAAKLIVSEKPVVKWAMAVHGDESLDDLGDGAFWGFGVDTGIAAFVDESIANDLADAAEEASANLDGWAGVVDENSMALFRAGYGDGSYPVWVGRDEHGDVAAVVADMLIVDGPDEFTAGP